MAKRKRAADPLSNDPLWYKDALIYQLHVRAFADSDGDGIGDFRGLTEKLDYIENLGVTAIWLLPFYPSPLKDDGYDIADYTTVHPSYGTLRDFNEFLRQAHQRGLRVITELVINHTSDQHAWFQRARRAPVGSRERDYYVWSDTDEKYKGTRIIFKDFESSNWSRDPAAEAYFWHRFYAHQPDLNFDSPHLRREIFKLMELWLGRGVDGLRLDAIPYLYEREGTSCENLPETHEFLKQLRAHVDRKFPNRMFLAEANQWPEDAVPYFGDGDECHMSFHFPLMPRLFMAIRMEDRYPIIEIMDQTPAIPDNCQWATFLRNHDELTLEMVTDRERDYMYQVYARDREARINLGIRRRLAPLLGNSRRAIELMNSLYFSLPGTPVIYYGDEIGMGDNFYLGDRNGVRTPMQWSPDRNAGFSRANSQRLYLPVVIDSEYHYEAVNVEAQEQNPRSLLWWMRRLIALRKRFKAFGRGNLEFLQPSNPKILSFTRSYQDEKILVVANLSRFAQYVELDVEGLAGMVPVELFGGGHFGSIEDKPYPMTLGPYAFYWFALEPAKTEVSPLAEAEKGKRPTVRSTGGWQDLLSGRQRSKLESLLPEYLKSRYWFVGAGEELQHVRIADHIRIPYGGGAGQLLVLNAVYRNGAEETYLMPLAFAQGEEAATIESEMRNAVFVHAETQKEGEGLLFDALWKPAFACVLLEAAARSRQINGDKGTLQGSGNRELGRLFQAPAADLRPTVKAQQTSTVVVYGDQLVTKLIRRMDVGPSPDLETQRFLTETVGFSHTPPLLGALEYRLGRRDASTVAVIQRFAPNEGDLWTNLREFLQRYYERVLAHAFEPEVREVVEQPAPSPQTEPSLAVKEILGLHLDRMKLLGERTAELHQALASQPKDPVFAPEAFTGFYQQAQYQAMRGQATRVLGQLKSRLGDLPEGFRDDAQRLLSRQKEIADLFRPIRDGRFTGVRIRTHGNYHLEQVLFTGKDFVIVDFKGEPGRSISERRTKNSPLRDVAAMVRSLHYAALHSALQQAEQLGAGHLEALEPWRRFWFQWMSRTFLDGYFATAHEAGFLAKEPKETEQLLRLYLLDRALYEIGYEMRNRPGWLGVPVRGLKEALEMRSEPVI